MNVFKIRKKLSLDAPVIKHELFNTIMATYPTDTKFEEDVKWIFDAEEFKNTKIIL